MKEVRFILGLFIIPLLASSQGPVGSWSDHLPYQSVNWIAAGENEVIGATTYALTVYKKEFSELKKMSKVNGLTESGISTIGYSSVNDSYIIAYDNTNIDVLKNSTIINVPDIYNKYIAGIKEIKRIRPLGDYAYLATTFGIVILDLDRIEIYDTWKPGPDGESNTVFDIAFMGDNVYAATEKGLFRGSTSNPGLSYFGNWAMVPGTSPGKMYNAVASINDRLFINSREDEGSDDILLMLQNNIFTVMTGSPGAKNNSMEVALDKLVVASGQTISTYSSEGIQLDIISGYGWGIPEASNATISDGVMYIADRIAGIVSTSDMVSFNSMIPPGPYLNTNSDIFYGNGNIYVSGGSVDNAWNNNFNSFQAHFFIDRKWNTLIDYEAWDAMRIRPHPLNPDRIFASSWGSGLFEYTSETITSHWDDSNSPLESIIPGERYVRVCGLAFDRDKNLWMTQTGVEGSIKVLKNDGSWIVLPYTISAPTIGDIIITRSGMKWIVLPRGHGLFVLDDNMTNDNFSDDQYKKFTPRDQDGNPLPNIYSIEEDGDGNIWIGTDQGPAVFYNPDLLFDRDIPAYRIKIPRNDGSGLADILLGTETITSIAADGGNRKWFGTNSSGAYLVSPDGLELIHTYNSSNSPVLSDNITSVEVDGKTGEVWIGSSKGIVTVRESATSGSDSMNHIYSYPNPVREDYAGDVTITGLMTGTNVKVTDISGNLVFETTSVGGQASWDLNNYRGERVSTGVYLIFCTNDDGTVSAVTKLLVIR